MTNSIKNAKKIYNEEIRKYQYVTAEGIVLITCKTEKGIDSEWIKYKNVWN